MCANGVDLGHSCRLCGKPLLSCWDDGPAISWHMHEADARECAETITVPRCELHGEMHLRLAVDPARDTGSVALAYICHGFDGEGCSRLVVLNSSGNAEDAPSCPDAPSVALPIELHPPERMAGLEPATPGVSVATRPEVPRA